LRPASDPLRHRNGLVYARNDPLSRRNDSLRADNDPERGRNNPVRDHNAALSPRNGLVRPRNGSLRCLARMARPAYFREGRARPSVRAVRFATHAPADHPSPATRHSFAPLRLCVNSAFPISVFCFQFFSFYFSVSFSPPATRHSFLLLGTEIYGNNLVTNRWKRECGARDGACGMAANFV